MLAAEVEAIRTLARAVRDETPLRRTAGGAIEPSPAWSFLLACFAFNRAYDAMDWRASLSQREVVRWPEDATEPSDLERLAALVKALRCGHATPRPVAAALRAEAVRLASVHASGDAAPPLEAWAGAEGDGDAWAALVGEPADARERFWQDLHRWHRALYRDRCGMVHDADGVLGSESDAQRWRRLAGAATLVVTLDVLAVAAGPADGAQSASSRGAASSCTSASANADAGGGDVDAAGT